jgi:hypothetical protein
MTKIIACLQELWNARQINTSTCLLERGDNGVLGCNAYISASSSSLPRLVQAGRFLVPSKPPQRRVYAFELGPLKFDKVSHIRRV